MTAAAYRHTGAPVLPGLHAGTAGWLAMWTAARQPACSTGFGAHAYAGHAPRGGSSVGSGDGDVLLVEAETILGGLLSERVEGALAGVDVSLGRAAVLELVDETREIVGD